MLPELAAEVTIFVIFLAIIGYLIFTFYKFGYYGAAIYHPSKGKGTVEDFFGHAAKGFILLFFLMFIIAYLFTSGIITIPDSLNGIQISPEIGSYILIANYMFFVLCFALLIGMILAGFFGKFQRIIPGTKVIIERNLLPTESPLVVREIYDEDERFYYYLDFKQYWGTIRKDEVKSMTCVETLIDERNAVLNDFFHPVSKTLSRLIECLKRKKPQKP